MKKSKNKAHLYKLHTFRSALGFLFIFLLNYCEAQIAQALPIERTNSKIFSGIYSSKNPPGFSYQNRESDSGNFLPVDFLKNYPGYKETEAKRTSTSRTFVDNKGGIIIQYSSKSIHYLDTENKFQPISIRLEGRKTSFASSASPEKREWSSTHQQFPTYLYQDGSTGLTSDKKNKIIFNKNCKINNSEINLSDYTVGEDGMFINNVIAGVDKKIVFGENAIETDYIIRQPISNGNQDLIISEELELPEGYYLASSTSSLSPLPIWRGDGGEVGEVFIVYSPEGIEQARFRTPVFYDAKKATAFGTYNIVRNENKNSLQIVVPDKWLSDPDRVYPITIDPLVTGPISNYPLIYMNSCLIPNYASDSMLVTIPGGITITSFIVEDSYFADAIMGALMKHGTMMLSTVCGAVTFSCQGTAADSSGTCYLVPNTDLKSNLACCFTPACTTQTFYLKHSLGRDNYGPGCNQTYIYYSPVSLAPPYPSTLFSAFIVGRTVETTQAQWSVFPTTICSDSCSVKLKVTTKFGVPPYTVTHPWATGASVYGASVGSCNSTGTDTIVLAIPGCPTTCGNSPTLSIPPPIIKDVCGDSVTGLSPKTITIKPVPVATATSISVCSGNIINIPVSSCVTGSTFQWTGNNGSNGSGNVSNVVMNSGVSSILVDYSVIPTADGCIGDAMTVSAEINPKPVINGGLDDSIESGMGAMLIASGGLNYLWTPSLGLTCTNCPNPTATPLISSTYYVTGTNEYGCSSSDTIDIFVAQNDEVLYIPNSFSPDENDVNDFFHVYGSFIKTIDIKIYDRWGGQIFQTNDLDLGWNGKWRGVDVEGGVYVYSVNCTWISGKKATRRGIVTVLR